MQILAEPVEVPGDVFEDREIPSDVALVTPTVVRLVEQLLTTSCIGDDGRTKIELCLDEAITNAIVHGNDEDFSKMVRIRLWKQTGCWGVVIEDEGEGFSLEDLSQRGEDEKLWQECGRGLALLTLYMDGITYFNNGSTLLLRKNI